jgi:hypothetical protein
MSKRNFDEMGKSELRAACKAADISYGKLTVGDMRDALKAKHAPAAPVVIAEPAPAVEPTPAPVAAEPVKKASAPKVQRERRNGVSCPGEGTACRAVWDALDAMLAAGVTPAAKDARDLAAAKGWNENNALIELSAWRKFNGLAKPQNMKPEAQAKAAPVARRIDGEAEQPTV